MIHNLADIFTLLTIRGERWRDFLQGQITCDIRSLKDRQGTFGAACNLKGRVVTFFYLFIWQNTPYLLVNKALAETTYKRLEKFATLSKVTIEPVLATIHGSDKPVKQNQNEAHIYLTPYPNNSDREFIICLDQQPPFPEEVSAGTDTWFMEDFAEGIPWLAPETVGCFLPQELGLIELNAISFKKGCYAGQEVVARVHFRGNLKQAMLPFTCAKAAISPNDDVTDSQGKVIGHVVNSAHDAITTAGLAVIAKAHERPLLIKGVAIASQLA